MPELKKVEIETEPTPQTPQALPDSQLAMAVSFGQMTETNKQLITEVSEAKAERSQTNSLLQALAADIQEMKSRQDNRTNYENREQTGNSSSEFDSQVDLRKPLKVRTRRRKTVKEESKKLTMVTLLASGCGALFTSVALITKHDHWQLRTDCQPTEAKILAEAINDALDTLPSKYYDIVTSIVEKWIPWINVCFVLCALVYDRIEQSEKLIERTHYKTSERGDKRYTDGATQASNVNSHTSLGYS